MSVKKLKDNGNADRPDWLQANPQQMNFDTRFGVRIPTERRFGISTQDRHFSYDMLKHQMPELNEFMPDHISINTLYKMRRDPMIQLGLHFIKVPLINARWSIQGPNEEEIKFLTWCTEQIWQKLLTNMLLALEFGYVGIIKRWKIARPPENLGLWKSSSVDPIIPDDVYALPPNLIEPRFTASGKFNGMVYVGQQGKITNIPDEYVLWFSHDLEASFGNLYGFPRIGYGYPYWRSYWFRWLLYDRHFEQDADPPLIVWGPSGTYDTEDGPRSYKDDGLMIAEQLRSGAGVYLPSTPYIDARTDSPSQAKQWDVRFEYGGHNIEGFQSTFEYLDIMKLRSILVPEQALVEGKGGSSSRNVAATYGAAFADSQSVLMKMLDAAFNEFYLDKLAFYNFGSEPGTYKKVTDSFLQENADLMGEIVKSVLSKDPLEGGVDMQKMAERLQFPMLSPEELEEKKQEKREAFVEQMKIMQTSKQPNSGNEETNKQEKED